MEQLPKTKSDALGGDIRGTEFLPFALYNLVEVPQSELLDLQSQLEKDQVIDVNDTQIHLVKLASPSIAKQSTLTDALKAHLRHCKDNKDDLAYFPYGFLVVHTKEWAKQGVYVVYTDFEEPHTVTGFRMKVDHVPEAASSLRDDDEDIAQLKEDLELKDDDE